MVCQAHVAARILRLCIAVLGAVVLAGCPSSGTIGFVGEPLGVRVRAVTPDPFVIDLTNLPLTDSIEIEYELIGRATNKDLSSCAPAKFTSGLTGVVVNLRDFPFQDEPCKDSGRRSARWQITFDRAALQTQPSGSYAARVEVGRCYDDIGVGEKCTTAQFTFTIELRGAAPPAPPRQPQNFAAAVDGPTIVLTWLDEPGAQSYLLEDQTPAGDFVAVATLPAFTTTYRDTNPALNTLSTYRLTAINDAGSSAPVTASAQIVVTRTLTVALQARGDSVTSSPAGIACTVGTCSATYAINALVVLTPTAAGTSRFVRWEGDPDCSDGSVTMDADKMCFATFISFDDKLVTVAVAGNGRVTSNPARIACPGLCSELFSGGSSVFLTATPSLGSVFLRWTGDPDCNDGVLEMNADKSCTATFTLTPGTGVTLTVYIQGTGSVSSTAAVLCSSDVDPCNAQFALGTGLSLFATPGPDQAFLGWAGSADCADGQLGLSTDTTCVANFVSTAAQWRLGVTALNQTSQITSASIREPAIVVDAAGRPVVAWTEDSNVYLFRPFGAGATRVSVNPSNGAPSLVMEPSDGPLVAVVEDSATDRRNVRLRRFPSSHQMGSVWVDVGPGPLDTTLSADAWDPFVVIRNGRITVTWVEGEPGAGSRIVVRSWDGTQWSAVGNGGGPAPSAASSESQRPRLVVTGTAPLQSLAVMWGEDFQTLRVAELVGDNWVATATTPYAAPVQTERADMMWTTDLGLVVAAAPASGGSLVVRRWAQGQWADVGTARGDTNPGAFVIGLAFSHGPADATPLLAYAINRSSGAVQETVVERFVGASWVRLGNALPAIDRNVMTASPRFVAVADHAQPQVAVVLQGVLPGTATSDRTLAVYHFE